MHNSQMSFTQIARWASHKLSNGPNTNFQMGFTQIARWALYKLPDGHHTNRQMGFTQIARWAPHNLHHVSPEVSDCGSRSACSEWA